jgi:hypothetical protein
MNCCEIKKEILCLQRQLVCKEAKLQSLELCVTTTKIDIKCLNARIKALSTVCPTNPVNV